MEDMDLDFHNKLNPAIWNDDNTIKESVRKKLLMVAEKFMEKSDAEISVEDILIVGSNANYNWNNGSDIDIHIISIFDDSPGDEYKKALLDKERKLWNLTHEIKIEGFDVEMYVEDSRDGRVSSGVYSLQDDKWINKPTRFEKLTAEKIDYVKKKYIRYKAKISTIIRMYETGRKSDIEVHNSLKKLMDKLREKRKDALQKDGETAVFNLVYKKLRANGHIDRMFQIMGESFDRSLSVR